MPVTTKTASHSANKFLESSLCNDVQDFFSVDTSFHLFAKELLASNFQSRDNVKQSFQSLKNTCLVNNPSSAGLIPRVGSHATTGFWPELSLCQKVRPQPWGRPEVEYAVQVVSEMGSTIVCHYWSTVVCRGPSTWTPYRGPEKTKLQAEPRRPNKTSNDVDAKGFCCNFYVPLKNPWKIRFRILR